MAIRPSDVDVVTWAKLQAQAGAARPAGLPPKARGRRAAHTPGRMNQTEAAYAEHLDAQKRAGDVLWWAFEPIKLRLADKTFYTADFLVMVADGTLECHETKGGFIEDDAIVKLKVAARLYPVFTFVLVQKKRREWSFKAIPS